MVRAVLRLCACIVLLMVVVTDGAGHKPKKVRCKDKKHPDCYKKDLFCPDSCLRTCEVDCVSCQPVCPASPPPPPPPPPPPKKPKRPPPPPTRARPPPPPKVRLPPPPKKVPPPPPPSLIYTHSPPLGPIITPPSSPPPSPIITPTPSPPPSSSSPPPTSSPPPLTSPTKAYCKNKNYPHCYRQEHNCPNSCPDQCEVDCVTCSPVCDCNKPGAICQDPRFIGGDGITFYFHGKTGQEFCIVSDPNLHINAHFIGRRNKNMKRDFTWVQSLGILFDNHQLFVGAMKTSNWDNAVDRLELTFDGEPIYLPEGEGAQWNPTAATNVSIIRSRDTNSVVIEVEGNFKIRANVVPITRKDSQVHNYGITDEDCFAHLDLGFKFYSLSGNVNGVLGQTYASNYTTRANMSVAMPVLGGDKEFASSSLFSTDCDVARFGGHSDSPMTFEYANMNCESGIDGRGLICKR